MTETQLNTLVDVIKRFENVTKSSYTAYVDPPGHSVAKSIGYGIQIIGVDNLITSNGKKIQTELGLTEQEFRVKADSKTLTITQTLATKLIKDDIGDRIKIAEKRFSNWNMMPFKAQVAVINIMYQYGNDSFKVTMQSVKNGDYEDAAKKFLVQKYLYDSGDIRELYNARLFLESADEISGDGKMKTKYGLK